MTTAIKRQRGRPSLTGETGQRYQVTIPPAIAEALRKHGDGSLSLGIILLLRKYAARLVKS